MKDVKGKVAFITGGGSGIGLGIAKAFADEGMKVVLADIRQSALDNAMAYFKEKGQPAHAIQLDVTDREAYTKAADEAEAVFEKIHVLVNNAGVSCGVPLAEATFKDWDWGLGIKLGGTVNGVTIILPRILKHGEDGHVIVTSSTNGFTATPGHAIYSTGMFAVSAMIEALAAELVDTNVSASVFYPGLIDTEINTSSTTEDVRPKNMRNEEKQEGATGEPPADIDAQMKKMMEDIKIMMMSSEEAGKRVFRGMMRDDLFIITHPEFKGAMEARCNALLRAIPDEEIDPRRYEIGKMFGPVFYNSYYDRQTTPPAPDWKK